MTQIDDTNRWHKSMTQIDDTNRWHKSMTQIKIYTCSEISSFCIATDFSSASCSKLHVACEISGVYYPEYAGYRRQLNLRIFNFGTTLLVPDLVRGY